MYSCRYTINNTPYGVPVRLAKGGEYKVIA